MSWANYITLPIYGLGYPGETMESKMMLYGSGAGRSNPPKATVLNYMPHLKDNEVDRAINSMPEIWQDAIKSKYVDSLSHTQASNKLGFKPRKYAYMLQEAHIYLAGKLNIRIA